MKTFALTLLVLAVAAPAAGAHGTTTTPASRGYICRFLDRDSAPCAYAWKKRPQGLYDWMGVRQANANGKHRAKIPDGTLCSANGEEFAALDRPSDKWLATELSPGEQTWAWYLNAQHATKYYRFYITKDGYDPTKPLRWDDLEQIYDSGPRGPHRTEKFQVDVPARTGRHLVYSVWQRSDSPEAFYACSDVVFGQKGDIPFVPVGPDEDLNQPGGGGGMDHMGHGGMGGMGGGKPSSRGIRLRRAIDNDWDAGYCATVTVTNRSKKARRWKGSMRFKDTITGLWNAKHSVRGGRLRVRGESFNATLAPKAKTTFGYCATR